MSKTMITERYPGWRPYCLVCDTMQRMEPRDYGWQCVACKNKINPDMTHYDGLRPYQREQLVLLEQLRKTGGVHALPAHDATPPGA